ncbi:hypothetical protein MKW98_021735 [Papaver atlanticum]|uniref:F-box domain-containing protein n=1 Tax=Papaver atlanticum TaxID=357466 RepID=A0AAD4XDG2_9MAGN|nr:hypothetical protein MKW98_021735 [Papaver atlanticum]
MSDFPEEVLELVFHFFTPHKDRNVVSLVCKSWFRAERWIKALTLKGKPHFADFNLVPRDWGGSVSPWIEATTKSYPGLEELWLKRMVVFDHSLELSSRLFPNFKSIVLVSCEGFIADGVAAIAANYRGQLLSFFPHTCTSLVSLNFACLKGEVDLGTLERLVARCPNLRSLKLNRLVPLEMLQRILTLAPHLVDLGTGSFIGKFKRETYDKLSKDVFECKSGRSLSGFLEVAPAWLPAMYSLFSNLTSLNLSNSLGIGVMELNAIVLRCNKLQRLWISDCIGDEGLQVVAFNCKELQELRVLPSFLYGGENACVTELGMVALTMGCPMLNSLLYVCQQMTNAALVAMAENCPNIVRFRLCILEPKKPNHVTLKPLDEGFREIVQSCKGLRRLSLSGLLTNMAFMYIGKYGEQLEMLSVAFVGESDMGMLYVLNGCKKLKKLEIRDSPFGNTALLTNMGKYEAMRYLWMSSFPVTLGGCKTLANTMQELNVEIMNEKQEKLDDIQKVDKLYVYRSLDGPRRDAPDFVWTL